MENITRIYNGLCLKMAHQHYYVYVWQHEFGHYCGYVEVPKESRLYGLHYDDDILSSISVHGGITYSDSFGDNWMYGFDCNHFGDFSPWYPDFGGHVWTEGEVLDECISFADQLLALEAKLNEAPEH